MDTTGLKRSAAMALALVLASCAENTRKPAEPAAAASATYGPAPAVAAVAPPAAPLTPPQPRPAPDQCGLDELKGAVGRSRLELPIPLEPGRRQVVCESCPRSRDVIPGRQTVLFDPRTGLVTSVSCG